MAATTFEYRMKPQGRVLAAYMRSMARVSLIMGPLGSGKTIQTCQKVFRFMCDQEPNAEGVRPTRFYAVRNTYPDLFGTTVKDWMSLFGELGQFKQGGMEPPTHYLKFRLEDGTKVEAELVFIALDRPDHVRKLRGAQATGFWLNETKELSKAVVDMADLRHGRYPSSASGGVRPTWHGMVGDTNAPDDDHWYHNLAEEILPEGWEFFRQPGGVMKVAGQWVLNPEAENLNNLPDGYYVRGMEGKSDEWISINLANEYGSVFDGKPIYPEFNERIHVASEILQPYRKLPLIVGWDFGLTPAAVVTQMTSRGQFRVLDELVSEDMGIRNFASRIVKPRLTNKYPGMEIISVIDPAGMERSQVDERTCRDELKAQRLNPIPARTNGFTARREAVAGFMSRLVDGEPGYLISPNCKILIRGNRGGYQYRRLLVPGEDRYTEKADKNMYSHPEDAKQYAALYCEAPPLASTRPKRARRTYRPASKAGGY